MNETAHEHATSETAHERATLEAVPLPPPSAVRTEPRRATKRPRSLRQLLIDEPTRFSFDAAVAVLMRATGRADPGAAIRFHASTGLGFASADVTGVEPLGASFRLTTGMLGLTGPGGLLPRPYTDLVNGEHRRRSTALAAFLDVLAQRAMAQFAAAGIKYRPHRSADAAAIADASGSEAPPADGLREGLLALTGHATPGLSERLPFGVDPLLYYAGAFATRPRSADRLGAILADWVDQEVTVEQFAGHWLEIGAAQMTRMAQAGQPGQFCQLGTEAAIGTRAWDVQSRIVLKVGPLPLEAFQALLPGGPMLARLTALTRTYLDGEVGFMVNPVLAADQVPALALGEPAPARLGWNSWLPTSAPRRHDADEASFASDDVATANTILGGTTWTSSAAR